MTAGLGVYDLFLNGELVGREVLKPGFTHFAKTKRSFTYDITGAFDKNPGARNVLSAQVTPGWWADKIVTTGDMETMQGLKCAFRGVLELTYADGSQVRLGTDTKNWTADIAGPVKHAGIFDGEEYDARCPMGFETPELLKTPEVNTEFRGEILPDNGAEIYQREDLTLEPMQIYVWEGVTGAVEAEDENEVEHGKIVIKRNYGTGDVIELNPGETLVVDFGQNAAAVPSFVFKADEGTKVITAPKNAAWTAPRAARTAATSAWTMTKSGSLTPSVRPRISYPLPPVAPSGDTATLPLPRMPRCSSRALFPSRSLPSPGIWKSARSKPEAF